MTAAHRLKGVGWLGACVACVLSFYLVSLQVAAERKKLDDVEGRIASAERDIRALETEFDTRANLHQLEKWNGDTLALSAPVAAQFVGDETALAALDARGLGGEAELRTAQLVVPAMPGALPTAPAAAPVAVAAAAPATLPPARAPRPAQGLDVGVIRVAAVTRPMPVVAPIVEARRTETARAKVAVAKVRPQAVAMLDRALLSDSTLGDLLASAKAEAGRRR